MTRGPRSRRRHPGGGRRGSLVVFHPEEAEAYASLIRHPRRLAVHICATPEAAQPVIAEAEILYAWRFPSELLAKATRLRWVQAMGAGVERFLTPELPSRVVVTRAPVFGTWMVEYVFGWCAWITQKMAVYREAQQEHRWITTVPDRLRSRTLVVVGVGEIGGMLAQTAKAFGMRVVGVTRSSRGGRGLDRAYRPAQLARALAEADFAVLCLPLTGETRGMIGARELAALRPHAWLLNVARGPIVDERALVAALESRRIGGAVLDVFDEEPLPPAHPLWSLPNTVITPHISGPSTPADIAPVFNDNLRRYLQGARLRHVVDRGRGY
jgi:phosphoglycerate dehydrogenase-like enzyme